MNWDSGIEKAEKIISLLVKYEAHAMVLVLAGVCLKLKGIEDPGLMLAGLAIFKGNKG